jgi:hypothetical protein
MANLNIDLFFLFSFYKKNNSHTNNNSLWLEMFGYRFIDNESIINNQKNVQLIDIKTPISEKKSKRIQSVQSYNELSVIRFVSIPSFEFLLKKNLE